MTDVAAALEAKLTGKSLDGARPIKTGMPTVEDFLTPPLALPAPKKNGKAVAA